MKLPSARPCTALLGKVACQVPLGCTVALRVCRVWLLALTKPRLTLVPTAVLLVLSAAAGALTVPLMRKAAAFSVALRTPSVAKVSTLSVGAVVWMASSLPLLSVLSTSPWALTPTFTS